MKKLDEYRNPKKIEKKSKDHSITASVKPLHRK
jgi:hypothetical protein